MPAARDGDGMTSSIVVAIADPAESRATLDLGIRAARLLQLPLVIGAVGESMEVVTTDQIGGWVGPLVDAKTVELSMRKDLAPLLASVPDDVVCSVDVVVSPQIVHGLEELVARHAPAAIVLGASRVGFVTRLLEGDHALGLVRHASCPVLIAPAEETEAAPGDTLRIGVAWDRTPEAADAMAAAAKLAARAGQPLRVVHVLQPVVPLLMPPADPKAGHELTTARSDEAAQEIRHAAAELGVPVVTEIRTGNPEVELEAVSRDLDVLVVGSRRRGPVRRVVLGSTSGALIHHSHCPIAVIPRGATVAATA